MKKLLSATVLVGALLFSAAAFANSEWYGKEGQDDTPRYMEKALSKLPADKANDFRDAMGEAHEKNKDLEMKVRTLHGELHDILTAPDFDKDAFLSKRREIQDIHDKMEQNNAEAFAGGVAELSQDERVTLTRSLKHQSPHHHGSHHAASNNPQIEDGNSATGQPDGAIKH